MSSAFIHRAGNLFFFLHAILFSFTLNMGTPWPTKLNWECFASLCLWCLQWRVQYYNHQYRCQQIKSHLFKLHYENIPYRVYEKGMWLLVYFVMWHQNWLLLFLCPLGMHQQKASMWKQQSRGSFNTCCKCEKKQQKLVCYVTMLMMLYNRWLWLLQAYINQKSSVWLLMWTISLKPLSSPSCSAKAFTCNH